MLKSAIIGCGIIAPLHAEGIEYSGNRPVAVADIIPERAKAFGEKYKAEYYTDYRELIKREDVDIVHICTPHHLHAQMALDCMKAGKHVLIEKPVAMSLDQAGEIALASSCTGMQTGVCFQNRYNPTSRKIKELIDSGITGDILGAKAIITWNRGREYYAGSDWKGRKKTEGGGVLINQAIHTLDLLIWFMGDISDVKGSVSTRLIEDMIEVENCAEGIISFGSGADAIVYATTCYCADSPIEIEIKCENAVINLKKELTIQYKDNTRETFKDQNRHNHGKEYWGCAHEDLIADFYDCVENNRKFPVDSKEGMKALDCVLRFYEKR